MNREETRKAAEVMLHFADGGEVECMDADNIGGWAGTASPLWAWSSIIYRKAQPKVSRYRRYVCTDVDGDMHVFVINEARGPVSFIEKHPSFIRWIDTEWQEAT